MTNASYFTVGTNDLSKSRPFYDALLYPQGFTAFYEFERGCIYASGDKSTLFGLLTPENGEAATVGNGGMGGLRMDSGEAVAAFHAKAMELGATTEGAPGERVPGAHFGYFRDLEGNKLCAFAIG